MTDQDSLRRAVDDAAMVAEAAYDESDDPYYADLADGLRLASLRAADPAAELRRVSDAILSLRPRDTPGRLAAARAMRATLARHGREAAHEQV